MSHFNVTMCATIFFKNVIKICLGLMLTLKYKHKHTSIVGLFHMGYPVHTYIHSSCINMVLHNTHYTIKVIIGPHISGIIICSGKI